MAEPIISQMTPKEILILQSLAMGRSIIQISVLLSMSRKSVEMRRRQLMEKYGFRSEMEIARFIHQNGL